jgi:RNA polymerase sigma-70 factor, ECF subfamily
LQNRDERVFSELVERWSSMMLRLALTHLENRAIAEDVVQEAWLTVLRSLDRFERRSALRTWVLGIVVNLARSRARAERRAHALSPETDGPSVDPKRFLPGAATGPSGDPRGAPAGWCLSDGRHCRIESSPAQSGQSTRAISFHGVNDALYDRFPGAGR